MGTMDTTASFPASSIWAHHPEISSNHSTTFSQSFYNTGATTGLQLLATQFNKTFWGEYCIMSISCRAGVSNSNTQRAKIKNLNNVVGQP
ncbi:TPA: hypothetical protein GDO54_018592 [Pyxicephalus adspersus]|uniref:Uncharacterized protein n=1 Tax=Pyxicephalus adspersus TaxID=30357 RepID=A0AAV2ZI92_PYXAD|nr:TPA: hypothetical protein GDO54_018592 [Pyxicephalus adspersus]